MYSMSFQCMNAATTKAMAASSRAAAIIEEAIMAVRTVAACNGQKTMVRRLSAELSVARRFGVIGYAWGGWWDGLFFFAMYIELAVGC